MTDVNKLQEQRTQLQQEVSELMSMRAKLASKFMLPIGLRRSLGLLADVPVAQAGSRRRCGMPTLT